MEALSRKALQSIFTDAVIHLHKQGCKSMNLTGNCTYRGLNNTSCAIGGLIKEEFYNSTLEGLLASSEDVRDALYKSGYSLEGSASWKEDPLLLLVKIQKQLHDDIPASSDKETFRQHLKQQAKGFAHMHQLTMPKLGDNS